MQPRRSLAILLMFSAALAVCSAAFADDLIGQASIIDGNTIEIHGTRIRIFGIDAPESDQLCRNEESELYRCGQKASNALFDFIARRPLDCVEVDRDRYNRTVAVCSVAGTDICDNGKLPNQEPRSVAIRARASSPIISCALVSVTRRENPSRPLAIFIKFSSAAWDDGDVTATISMVTFISSKTKSSPFTLIDSSRF
jgi:hypothetical protein